MNQQQEEAEKIRKRFVDILEKQKRQESKLKSKANEFKAQDIQNAQAMLCETVLSSQMISEDDTPRRKRAIFEQRKALEKNPLLILKGMIPARTHQAAKKQEEMKSLEKELAYYMGEIEKKF